MPRKETILTIFVASPSDVSDERDRLDTIVHEVNKTHARWTGVRLELVRWERDVSPAAGKDPQAIVNDQIPQDYEIFVGILWNRLGSPTRRADSGTVEEYEMAKERHDKDPDSVRLMLYFKDSPPPTMVGFEPDQYKKVQEFQSRVRNEAIYRIFSTVEDFANSIRLDLSKLLQETSSAHGHTGYAETSRTDCASGDGSRPLQDDDEGYFDLMEAFEEEMDSLNSTLGRMSDSITDVGGNLTIRAEEITALNSSVDGANLSRNEEQKHRADGLQIMRRSSKDMNAFVKRMEQDIPLFRRHLDKSISVFTKAVPIYLELNEGEDKEGLKDIIGSSLEAMKGMLASMESFRDAVDGLPRLTTSLNRSKRETKKVIQEVVDITRGGIATLEVVLSMLP